MPWRVTSPMYERQRFVLDAEHIPGRSPSRTPTRAISWPVRDSTARGSSRPSTSSVGSSAPTGSRSGSARIMGRPLPPVRSAASRSSASGGSASAFAPSSSSPPVRSRTGGTSGCTGISRRRPRALPPAPSAGAFGAQQRRFDAFRHTFHEVRPHEALDQRRPAAERLT